MPSIDQLPPLPVGSTDFNALHDAVVAGDLAAVEAVMEEAALRPDLLPHVVEVAQAAAVEAPAPFEEAAAEADTPAPTGRRSRSAETSTTETPADAGAVKEN